jgi:hypothetical protein
MLQIFRTKNRDLNVPCKRSADVSHHELYNSCTLIIFLFKGDSGGPVTVKNSVSQHTLAGVTSFGFKCIKSVNADVSFYRSWIDTNVAANGGAVYCS